MPSSPREWVTANPSLTLTSQRTSGRRRQTLGALTRRCLFLARLSSLRLPDQALSRAITGLILGHLFVYLGHALANQSGGQAIASGPFAPHNLMSPFGEVTEWLKVHAWKACVRETVPGVRIPPSPLKRHSRTSGTVLFRKSPPGNQPDAPAREYSSLLNRLSSDMARDALVRDWCENLAPAVVVHSARFLSAPRSRSVRLPPRRADPPPGHTGQPTRSTLTRSVEGRPRRRSGAHSGGLNPPETSRPRITPRCSRPGNRRRVRCSPNA
jgi:hypothetical protein